jgi:hypothetical protein
VHGLAKHEASIVVTARSTTLLTREGDESWGHRNPGMERCHGSAGILESDIAGGGE